ncbi:hypothetical protein DT075_15960 [Bacillus licheniformis]|nr:hypothetical protein DT075_15960 [Bacillus licheniformis]
MTCMFQSKRSLIGNYFEYFQAHEKGAKVYVAVNAIFHNDRVPELNDYLSFLDEAGADAVVFGDPAVLMAARESAPNMKLHWNTECGRRIGRQSKKR